jgi:hypothetical protein
MPGIRHFAPSSFAKAARATVRAGAGAQSLSHQQQPQTRGETEMNKILKNAATMSFAVILSAAAMSAPGAAYATTKVPGSCELVKNTVCGAPTTVLQQILSMISFG